MARGFSVFVGIGAKLLPSLGGSIRSVEERFGAMNRNLRLQAAEAKVAFGEMTAAASPLLKMAAAGGITMGVGKLFGDGAEFAHQISLMRLAGRSSQEMADGMAAAWRTIRAVPTSTLSDNIATLRETTMAFGSFKHAAENLPFVATMTAMTSNLLGDKAGDASGNAFAMIKALEMRGMGTARNPVFDPERFQREGNFMYQAMIASGGKVNPEEFLNFAKMASPFTKSLSDHFLYRIAPTMIGEVGGDRAGTMLSAWESTILGKAKNKITTDAFMKLGLLDPKGVVSNKMGPVGWMPGAMKGTDLALRDPQEWENKVLLPALIAHGIDPKNQLSLAKGLMPLFRDRNALRQATTLISDAARNEKDANMIGRVPGVNAAYQKALRSDPILASKALGGSFKTLGASIFGPGKNGASNPVAIAITNVARGINFLAATIDAHPWLKNGIGTMLLGGAGIASLKVFGVGIRWLLSPLKMLASPIRKAGTLLADTFGPGIARGIMAGGRLMLTGIGRFGGLIVRGFATLAPVIGEACAGAFALLSNPVGWAILATAAVVGVGVLIYHFRDSIGPALSKAWSAVKGAFVALPWRDIGLAVADTLTLGLATRLPAAIGWIKSKIGGSSGPQVAGHRASGGPVVGGRLYLVGERGPELFRAPMSGSIISASNAAAMARRRAPVYASRDRRGRPAAGSGGVQFRDIVINGVSDPQAVGREVRRELRAMAAAQNGYLSD